MGTIWIYWEDRPNRSAPPHVQLCREILKYRCRTCNIKIITPNNVYEYLPDLSPRVWEITMKNPKHNPIAVRCAFIRAFLLEKYGGIYIDSDCIVLEDLSAVFELLANYDFISMRRTTANSKHISIGFYGTRKNGKIISEYADKLRTILEKKTVFGWGECGAHMLTPIVNQYLGSVFLFREEQIHPIVAEKQELFLDVDLTPTAIIPEDALCLMLFHKLFDTSLRNITIIDLWNSDMFVSKVLREALPEKIFMKQLVNSESKNKYTELQEMTSNHLNLTRTPDKMLNNIHYYSPPVPTLKPLKRPNSSLKIAVIVSDRLYHGLQYEGELLVLTPQNWKYILQYAKPDLIIVESTWETATGHWYMAQIPASGEYKKLGEIIMASRKLAIPTIFWNTKDFLYHIYFKDFAKLFDYVYCADVREAELLKSEGIDVEVLLPCVQPAIYNPFREYDRYHGMDLGILFDGWADLDRFRNELDVLELINDRFSLSIIESRFLITRARLDTYSRLKKVILGCVTDEMRSLCLKYSSCYISFDKSLSTETEQQWRILEAAASRVPTVHYGTLDPKDLRVNTAIECCNRDSFLVKLHLFNEDPLYRQKQGHLAWRYANLNHTFSHRMQAICKRIGLKNDWTEYPPVSIITPTMRESFFQRCFDNYHRQKYTPKELLVVYNGSKPSFGNLKKEITENHDINFHIVPQDLFAGACMNIGHFNAKGSYFFRMDDDDYYGENYILDMMLYLRAIDADFFGKPVSLYYYFPDDKNSVYFRETKTYPLCLLTEKHLRAGQRFSGNTFSGTKEFFSKNLYQNNSYAAADSTFLFNAKFDGVKIATMDCLNMCAERRKDQLGHTWIIKDDRVLKNSATGFNHPECISI